jgi:Zn-dependent protease with chaperone function
MHLLMLLVTLWLAWRIRKSEFELSETCARRWQNAIRRFLLPPLLILMSMIAILCMGTHGHMVWGWEGFLSYGLSVGSVSLAIALFLKAACTAKQTIEQLQSHPIIDLQNRPARLLDTPELYCAQVGFWHPELVVSQGLLESLDSHHLEAVLMHEQMHVYHRDTFWFFWLGWIRRLTTWLPQTEALWQELLTLREFRADRSAAQQVDPLMLAESLLRVAGGPLLPSEVYAEVCAEFSWPSSPDRLAERIEILLSEPISEPSFYFWPYSWLIWVLCPLLIVPFHN